MEKLNENLSEQLKKEIELFIVNNIDDSKKKEGIIKLINETFLDKTPVVTNN